MKWAFSLIAAAAATCTLAQAALPVCIVGAGPSEAVPALPPFCNQTIAILSQAAFLAYIIQIMD
jgi:hypothetical protein